MRQLERTCPWGYHPGIKELEPREFKTNSDTIWVSRRIEILGSAENQMSITRSKILEQQCAWAKSRNVAVDKSGYTETLEANLFQPMHSDTLKDFQRGSGRRAVVFGRLCQQFAASGACRPSSKVKLCLACGRIASDTDREGLRKFFANKGWELWDEKWLRQQLQSMSKRGYENQVSAVVAKLLLRGGIE
jgi:hypothetical protein